MQYCDMSYDQLREEADRLRCDVQTSQTELDLEMIDTLMEQKKSEGKYQESKEDAQENLCLTCKMEYQLYRELLGTIRGMKTDQYVHGSNIAYAASHCIEHIRQCEMCKNK